MKRGIILFFFVLLISCSEKENDSKPQPENKTAAAVSESVRLKRVYEPNEKAFSLLVPEGWRISGGIFRVDPTAAGGSGQSIAAKLDFTMQSNDGRVLMRWLPEMLYFDASRSPAGQMGLFPPGSNYNGMTVYQVMSPQKFINDIIIPYVHKNSGSFRIMEQKELNKVASGYSKRMNKISPFIKFSHKAGFAKYRYSAGGGEFEEMIFTIIEDWGEVGAGLWGNKESFLVKTPAGEMDKWAPILRSIGNSVKLNPKWVEKEIRGQIKRGEIALNTQREIQELERSIVENRQKTNAEINNDMYLTLTAHEEYVNPYTNEVETGTNEWKYRWVNESGDVIYTDDENYDPNSDVNINRSDYKKSQVRKRYGEK